MQFDALLGNDVLKQRLCAAIGKGQTSHCYLISGPQGAGKRTLARLLSAALQCTSEARRPCLQCPQCRKVLDGVHPDVITVDDAEHKTLPVKLVRQICSEVYLRPNEGQKKIYIFPRAQAMAEQGQNALLKCIEEPPAYAVFLLLSEHPEQLLPTIRSRCAQLRLSPLPEAQLRAELKRRVPDAEDTALAAATVRSGGYLGQALALLQENTDLFPQTHDFIAAYSAADAVGLLRLLSPMEKLGREQLRPILLQWREILSAALSVRSGLPAMQRSAAQLARTRSTSALLQAADALGEALRLLDANVGTAHICGGLAILLR